MSNSISTVPPRAGGGEPIIIDSPERIRESYSDYLSDESRYGPADAERLVLAVDELQVAETLNDARDRDGEVTVSAGRTGIVGGAVPPSGTLLSLERMDRVLGVRRTDGDGFILRAQPGISVAALRERLESGDLGLDPSALDAGEREALDALTSDERGWFYPPDPTEDTAHLGATVATNASGARSYRYGATRKHVAGLRVVLPCGEVVDVDRGSCSADGRRFEIVTGAGRTAFEVPSYRMPSTKNAAGYFAGSGMDLIDLFTGSEGTLGVITEVRLFLTRKPEGILSALAFFDSDEDAVAFVSQARDEADPLALEFFGSRSFDFLRERKTEEGQGSEIPELPDDARAGIIFEQDYVENDLMDLYEKWEALLSAHGSSMERTWGGLEESEIVRLKALRHGVAEEVNSAIARAKAEHPEIHKVGTDAAVPRGQLPGMLAYCRELLEPQGLRYIIFGHIGDSHLHLNIMPGTPDELARGKEMATAVAGRAVELGGTVSAEHGIGRIKHEFLRIMYGDEGLAQMAAVKRALDPDGVLNRGVMFPAELLQAN